jgi:hypothetical protein
VEFLHVVPKRRETWHVATLSIIGQTLSHYWSDPINNLPLLRRILTITSEEEEEDSNPYRLNKTLNGRIPGFRFQKWTIGVHYWKNCVHFWKIGTHY